MMQAIKKRVRCTYAGSAIVGLAFGAAACGHAPEPQPESIGSTEQALNGYNYSDNRAWSQSPPGGIAVSNAPQFVEIGFDDNYI